MYYTSLTLIHFIYFKSFYPVYPAVKEPPIKESDLSEGGEEHTVQEVKRDSSTTDDSDIVKGARNGSDKDDGAGTLGDVGGKASGSYDGEKNMSSPAKTKKEHVAKDTGKKKKKERNDAEDQAVVSTEESPGHGYFTRKRKLNVVFPKQKPSQVKKRGGSKMVESSDSDEDDDLTDFEDDEDDVHVGGSHDSDDAWIEEEEEDEEPEDEEGEDTEEEEGEEMEEEEGEEMEEEEGEEMEEEKEMEIEESKESNDMLGENQEGREARVCEKCASVFYTPWDYDLHSIDCSLAVSRTEYSCHLCQRKCATKWGITYHLMKKHRFSGPEALAKVPELDVRTQMFQEDGGTCETSNNGGDDGDATVKATDGNEEIRNLVEGIVDNIPIGNGGNDADAPQKATSGDEEIGKDLVEGIVTNSARGSGVDDEDAPEKAMDGDKEIEKELVEGIVNRTLEDLCLQGSEEMAGDVEGGSFNDSRRESKDGDKLCKICFIELPSKNALYDHTKEAHFGLQENFKCSTCDKNFTKRDLFRKHVKAHVKRGWGQTYKCDTCEKVFSSQAAFTNHSSIHGDKEQAFKSGSFLCDLCGSVYKTQGSFNTHRRERHEGSNTYKCTHCDKRFYYLSRLRRHAVIHTKDGLRQCEICEMKFRFHYEYVAHINDHKGIEQMSCRICHRFFKKQSTLLRHMQNVHDKKNAFFCDECDFGSPDFSILEKHKTEVHETYAKTVDAERLGTKPFVYELKHKCDECGQEFHHKYDLKIHQNRHRGIEPFTCMVCSKEFLKEKSYKNHVSIHGVLAIRYRCEECDNGYKSYRQYKKHMADEHGKKLLKIKPFANDMRFKCDECGQQFHRKYDFKIHMSRHQGIEVYTCPVCNKEFLKRKTYFNHMTTHKLSAVRHTCEECSESFKSYRQYRIHMAEVHNVKLKQSQKTPKSPKKRKTEKSPPEDEEKSPPEDEEKSPPEDEEDSAPHSLLLLHDTANSMEHTTVNVQVEEQQGVDPTMAIIQMLCQEQSEIHVVVETTTA